jgi:hypothetical protein
VKVKREDGETEKRNVEYDPDRRDSIMPSARDLIGDVLPKYGLDQPDGDLAPSLVTRFQRATVAARDRPERTTFDFAVNLEAVDDGSVELDQRYAIAETKTRDGDGAWDRALGEAGLEPVSLSKYRVGAGLLQANGKDADYAREVKRAFTRASSRG